MNGLKKKELGQFNTTNVDYIFEGFETAIKGKKVIDPFCGRNDLIDWAIKHGAKITFGIDIDDSLKEPNIYQDSLKNPYEYTNDFFILMNPPYLAKNKTKDKSIFLKYKTDDLYKAAIQSVMKADEGIFIIPINFLSSRENKTRKLFFSDFYIEKCKLFEKKVFSDTTSTVIAFHYKRGKHKPFPLLIEPSKKEMLITLKAEYNYLFGSKFFDIIEKGKGHGIKRLRLGDPTPSSKLFLNALDGGSNKNRISLSLAEPFYGKATDRAKATLVLKQDLNLETQQLICDKFNEILEKYREEYHSLFLSNYRESSSLYARKRIGFEQSYKLVGAIIKDIK